MILAEPQWLRTLGQIAGTMLLLELCFVLLLVCVIVGALAYASWWLHHNVIPVLDQYGGKAQQYMGVAIQGSDRVVSGVAEFRGRWEAVATGARVMLFGTRGAKRSVLPASATAEAAIGGDHAHENHPTTPPIPLIPLIPSIPSLPSVPSVPATPDPSQHVENPHQIGLNGHAE